MLDNANGLIEKFSQTVPPYTKTLFESTTVSRNIYKTNVRRGNVLMSIAVEFIKSFSDDPYDPDKTVFIEFEIPEVINIVTEYFLVPKRYAGEEFTLVSINSTQDSCTKEIVLDGDIDAENLGRITLPFGPINFTIPYTLQEDELTAKIDQNLLPYDEFIPYIPNLSKT